jgi:transcriptional regulator with XRE-family HTH domain
MKQSTDFYPKLCEIIRLLRILRNETVTSMAVKLGYANDSSYSKIERGECAKLDIVVLHQIADILGVSTFHLCRIAGLDLSQHKNSIQTWSELIQSIEASEDQYYKHKLLNNLPPPPEIWKK